MKPELQSNLERAFALASLRAGVRVDGRALDASRKLRIVLGPAHGQAQVSLGATTALASASAEPVAPYPDRPADGLLSVAVELSPAASEPAAHEFAVHASHPPSDRAAVALRASVDRFIRDSRAVDTEALCILAGRKVWAVSVSVSVVDAAGNAEDAAHLAAMAALLHARRNDVSISGTDVHIHPFSEREPLPLPVHHVPLSVTYALYGGTDDFPADVAALDPCLGEELAADGSLSVCMNAHGEVCGLQKSGGLPVDAMLVARCAAVAADRVVAVTELLNAALEESSARHHPLSASRPVLVAPEPTAIIRKPQKASMAAGTDGDGDAVMHGGEVASMWNAVPADDAPPPAIVAVKGDGAKEVSEEGVDDDIAAIAFRSLEKKPQLKASDANKSAKTVNVEPPAAEKPTKVQNSSNSSSDDSDEDLMAAVIAKPKGGGARRSKKK